MATELRKLGATVEEGADWLAVVSAPRTTLGPTAMPPSTPTTTTAWRCASRWLALGGVPVRINDPKCVAKTFPDYFERFGRIAAPVIAIDGPSASGKGTVAQRVAETLGFHFLDSGALYRLTALAAIRAGVALDDEAGVAAVAAALPAEFPGDRILLAGDDVTEAIRAEEIGVGASKVAALPAVRTALLERQRAYRRLPGLVADGRDMGSVVFPEAPVKVFLTASAEARAERRYKQLIGKGMPANMLTLLQDLRERDARDAARSVAPLKQGDDAELVDTTPLGIDEAVAAVLDIVRRQAAAVKGRDNGDPDRLGVATVPGCRGNVQPTRHLAWQLEVSMSATAAAAVNPAESFAALFEESLTRKEMRAGEVITAEVVRVDQNFVVVNAGLKSESFIPAEEFKNDRGEVEANPGDFVRVAIEMLEDGYGETRLSRDKAKRIAAWNDLDKALTDQALVKGVITGKVKGGLTVMINGIRAFLPGSLVDTRPVKDTTPFEGKEFEFKVIKLDRKRNNVVVSRRAVLEANMGEERQKLLENLQEGTIVKGIVKNITDYGAFVDLGGIDGLLHITDLAWRRVRHPSEVINVGDEVTAKVLKFDQEKNRVSLGMKQLGEDPWVGISRRYPSGTRLFGKVTNLTDYGAFVEIEQGIEGLVHVSEMDWTNKNIHPSKVVQLGDEVEVMILEIDEERRRISLGMKQCHVQSVGRFRHEPQEGRQGEGRHQVDHRLRHLHRPARRHRRPGAPVRPVLVGHRRGSHAELQEGRRGRGHGAVDRRREGAHFPRHQADGRRPLHQLHRHPRQEQPRQRHGEERRSARRGDRAGQRCRGLPARLRVRPRAHRGPVAAPQGRRIGRGPDHQRRSQDAFDQPVDQGQGPGRAERGDAEAGSDSSSASSGTTNLGALLKAKLNQQ